MYDVFSEFMPYVKKSLMITIVVIVRKNNSLARLPFSTSPSFDIHLFIRRRRRRRRRR